MSRVIAILAGIIVILIAVVVAVPMFIPMETYKAQIQKIAQQQTGRDLKIDGDMSLSFFPSIGVEVNDVAFANAAWGKAPEMATMKSMHVSLKLLPLFSGNVEVDSFTLKDPVINLEVRKDGTPNWQFETAAAPVPAEAAPEATGDAGGGASLNQVKLGEVSISGGTANYTNAQTGAAYSFKDVNLDLSLPSLDDPFEAEGSVVWNGDKIDVDLAAARPRALTDGGETPVSLSVSSPKLDTSYEGSFKLIDGLAFGGDVSLDVPSVRELAAWAGNPMPAGNGFGKLSITGKATGAQDRYSFKNAKIAFDGMNAEGNLDVRTGGARPRIGGDLSVDKIDVNTYSAGGAGSGGASSGGASSGGGGDAGWSTAPMDFSALKSVDADLDLKAGKILVQAIEIGESAVNVKLNNGVLNANLTRLALYGGAGNGTLKVNGASSTPQIGANFNISGVQAQPLLQAAAGFNRLTGSTAMDIAVTTAGKSQKAMVSALNGKGAFKFTDGKVKGVDLANLVRTVLSATKSGWDAGGSQDTDFSELSGSYTITRGILKNDDLRLMSPLIRVTGAGTVDMPAKTLNYRVQPKLVGTLEGQGGTTDAKGIEVPILIRGPWSRPSFTPDLASMLSNPEQTKETIDTIRKEGIKGVLKQFGGGSGGDAANDNGSSDSGTTEEKKVSPKDALKSLFGN
ncbi:AsmA protein [Parvibaculum indicum]|uniref:AsmA family protein n=1 Tax=Parvibaculum indicum TaxID=562969 RepID=UPI00141E1C68|nr:AsmA family protein [Parvibaculum indicum]NIJ41874.1 AsmA protein [Parvibaculum indicum]